MGRFGSSSTTQHISNVHGYLLLKKFPIPFSEEISFAHEEITGKIGNGVKPLTDRQKTMCVYSLISYFRQPHAEVFLIAISDIIALVFGITATVPGVAAVVATLVTRDSRRYVGTRTPRLHDSPSTLLISLVKLTLRVYQ